MNKELYKKLESIKKGYENTDKNLRKEYNEKSAANVSVDELNKISAVLFKNYDDHKEICDEIKSLEIADSKVKNAMNNYSTNRTEENKKCLEEATNYLNTLEMALANKYSIDLTLVNNYKSTSSKPNELETKPKAETVCKNKRGIKVAAGVLAGAALFGLGHHAEDIVGLFDKQTEQEKDAEDEKEEEKPFETYGQFINASDEKEVEERAKWYYETYFKDQENTANPITLENIKEDIKIINGEFVTDSNGNIEYNDTDVINVANDIHTIANYNSFKQYGNNIKFVPMAPLFEDGSLAQKAAIDLDEAMSEVIEAINKDDKDAFLEASQKWGNLVINMFDYTDFDGKSVSIYQVDAPTSFQLYHVMYSRYASTILEYSEKPENKINICLDYCTDYNTGETKQISLSEEMYNINNRMIDAVAVRSGNLKEYESNNMSLPEHLCVEAKEYFNSKYNLENGYTKKLK